MIKKLVLIIFITPLIIISCNQPESGKPARNKGKVSYVIGINLPLSGNGSYFAEEVRKGLDLAFSHAMRDTARMQLEVLYEDNKLNPRDAVSITRKFVDVDKVDLIISGYTPVIQAIIDLVDNMEVPMLVTLSSTESIAAPYRWVFRDFELESVNMPLLAAYAYTEMGLGKGTYLVVNDDMGRDAVKFFSEAFTLLGGSIIPGEVFEAAEMDLRNKINKIVAFDPEFIIVIGRGSAMINALRQIRERDPDIPIFSNNTVDNEQIWEALHEKGNNIWFPRPFSNRQGDAVVKADNMFREKYGHGMNWLNIYGVSIGNYLVKGLKRTGGEKDSLRQYLEGLDVQTIRGRLVMNENHDVTGATEIFTRHKGETVQAFTQKHQ